MNKATLFLGILCTALLGSNAYLLHLNTTLIEQHRADVDRHLPETGVSLAPITVRDTRGAERPLVFDKDAPHPRLLLVVSPDCPYCDRNWPMWDALIQALPSGVTVTYFDVTGKFDGRMSAAHGIRDEQLITAPLESAIQARIVGTPTTVLIARDGTVGKVWQGVLGRGDVDDILAMSRRP